VKQNFVLTSSLALLFFSATALAEVTTTNTNNGNLVMQDIPEIPTSIVSSLNRYQNVRGSAGYGKHYMSLDNGFKREDSVKDIGALLDWIETQPDLDQNRVAVYGGSYGGYMVLASAVHYSDRLKAAVDVVGISPLTHVDKIKVPMLVVQGENDPRVPVTEAVQVVEALRAQGQPVWYMNALNEGHGYRKKENRDVYQQAVIMFLQEYLTGEDQ